MRLAVLLFLLCSALISPRAQTVLNGAVLPDGWVVLRISDGATNGTFDWGYEDGTNHVFNGSEKFYLNVNAPGYEGTATNIFNLKVFGTWQLRWADPSGAFPRTAMDGTDVLIYFALHDYIYADDTGMEATIGAGLYTFGGTPNSAATITLTNWSQQTYTKVIPGWRTIPFQQITNTTVRLHAFGAHASAGGGQPLAAMQFFVTDESGASVSSTVTRMAIDLTRGERRRNAEYFDDLNIAGLAHNNLLRYDLRALPRRGNPASVFDTRDNTYSWPTFLPCSITNYYYTNALGGVARVGTSGIGNDTNGVVYEPGTDPATIPSSEWFLTGSRASYGIRTNNAHRRGVDDVSSGVVYFNSGTDRPFGSTAWTFGNIPKTFLTFKPFPGDSVTFTNDAGTDDISDRLIVEGFTISPIPNTAIMFNNIQALRFKNCTWDDVSTSLGPVRYSSVPNPGVVYYTGNDFVDWRVGIPFPSGTEIQHVFLWDNDLSGLNAQVIWMNAVGNWKTNDNPSPLFTWLDDSAALQNPLKEYQISYNNHLLNITNLTGASIGAVRPIAIGKAFVQNVLEFSHSSIGSFPISASGTHAATNVLFFQNTIGWKYKLGRLQMFYNEAGGANAVKAKNFVKNSILTVPGEASDTDGAGHTAGTNNWTMQWRVGCSGNIILMVTNNPPVIHGNPSFTGMHTFRPPDSSVTPLAWPRFINGNNSDAGARNYRLHSDSPILHPDYASFEWVWPFDMDGVPRGRFDQPGAFVAGNAKRGGFF